MTVQTDRTQGQCVLTRERLHATLTAALVFASTDKDRPGMCGVELRMAEGRFEAWATDGRGLVRLRPYITEPRGSARAFFSYAAMKAMAKTIKPTKKSEREMLLTLSLGDQLTVEGGDIPLRIPRVDERPPNYQAVVNIAAKEGSKRAQEFGLNAKLLLQISKAYRAFIKDGLGPRIVVPKDGGSAVIFERDDAMFGGLFGLAMPFAE